MQVLDVLELSSFRDSILVAGANGVDRNVSSIMIMEAPDIECWMRPSQILLTSLYGVLNYTETQLYALVKDISDRQGAGIIIKTNRFIDQIPSIIRQACDDYSLPLIQIPLTTQYEDVLREVLQAVGDGAANTPPKPTDRAEQWRAHLDEFFDWLILDGSTQTHSLRNALELLGLERDKLYQLAILDVTPIHEDRGAGRGGERSAGLDAGRSAGLDAGRGAGLDAGRGAERARNQSATCTEDDTITLQQMRRFTRQLATRLQVSAHRAWRDHAVLLMPEQTDSGMYFKPTLASLLPDLIQQIFGQKLEYHVCINSACSIDDLRHEYANLSSMFNFLKHQSKGMFVTTMRDTGLYRLLLDETNRKRLNSLVPRYAAHLHNTDADLERTLRVYLECSLSLNGSAEKLHVHPKTIRYRLHKIETQSGFDFENPEERLRYNVGFCALDVLDFLNNDTN
jgi:DNA-binding PucR family transcriptional regulator